MALFGQHSYIFLPKEAVLHGTFTEVKIDPQAKETAPQHVQAIFANGNKVNIHTKLVLDQIPDIDELIEQIVSVISKNATHTVAIRQLSGKEINLVSFATLSTARVLQLNIRKALKEFAGAVLNGVIR